MMIETALKKLMAHYAEALMRDWVIDKVAWALYQTWKDADKERKENEQRT